MKESAVGFPLPRVEAHAKVTGTARYASEFDQPEQAYAVLVTSTIALGRVTSIDGAGIAHSPGVLAVISHLNAPRLHYREQRAFTDPAVGERLHVLQDDQVRFFGQPIAIVVAATLDQAEHAAAALTVKYEAADAVVQMEGQGTKEVVPEAATKPGTRVLADYARGDAEASFREASGRVDARFEIARENHSPMEPHATVATWNGDRLTLWSKSQFVSNEAAQIAAVFGLPAENVEVICPFIGGGFGTGLRTWSHVTLAAVAARQVKRPVKLVLTRRQMFYNTGHRPRTIQRVALGADTEGRLSAIIHEGTGETSRYEEFIEALTQLSGYMYSCPNVSTRYRIAPLDIGSPNHMRGPGEASGSFALESAMDELAIALDMDPVELRLRNEPSVYEVDNRPFSSRSLTSCLKLAADRFGWSQRDPRPRSRRDGHLLVGLGMACATYPTFRGPAGARARLMADGTVEVEAAASDMGPGTYTSLTQVAADALGLLPSQIRVRIGQSSFPATPPHGGSMTMASVGSAVHVACSALRDDIVSRAIAQERSPLSGAELRAVDVDLGWVTLRSDPSRKQHYREIVAQAGGTPIEVTRTSQAGDEVKRYSMHSFGAVFVEVGVDADLGQITVRRAVGAYAVGRVINPRLAHSQVVGGMTGGIGMALMEATVLDRRDGRPVNASMADYLVPVNLDIGGPLEAYFVEENDSQVNPLGAKGLGELALIGMAPAIANAVYHATGRRVRHLPIRIESLLE